MADQEPQNELISILMPVYNAASFLPECLESIRAQTDTNWELLAVNDFSTDNSWKILQQHAALDVRIQPLQNISKGIIPALRRAYRYSRGKLITRMDADDRMAPDKLALFREALQEKGPGYLVTGLVSYFSDNGVQDGYRRYEEWLNALTRESRNFEEIYRECVIPSPNWMVHRADLDASGAFQHDNYPEDYDLCFRFYEQGLQVEGLDTVTHYWRDHPDRVSRNDEHYADNRYLAIKLPYFLKLDCEKERPLILWGAGKKGKLLARMLEARAVDFEWVCDTPTKWGKEIDGKIIQATERLHEIENPQIIVAVAAPDDQEEILAFCRKMGWEMGKEVFFFC